MSWSLRISHGDFVLSGAQLATVTNEEKLVQDLRCALLERMGTDDMHIDYGSLIDGGRLPDGTDAPSVVGMTVPQAAAVVQSEIQRLTTAYKSQQLDRAKTDRLIYNRVSLSPAEVLLSVTKTAMTQVNDTLQVVITLQTARGESLTIALPLLANT